MSFRETQPDWTRRRLLASGCASIGTIALGGAAQVRGSNIGQQDEPYYPFKMGIQSYSLRGYTRDGHADLAKALAVTKELGLHYWESYTAHVPVLANPQNATVVKREFEASGIQLVGYGVVRLTKDESATRRIFQYAKALGVQYLSISPTAEALDHVDRMVEQYGIAAGIHNHGPGDHYAKIETIAAAIKDHHPKIGCCIDTGHFLRSKEDPVHAVEAFGQRVYGVHLKDVKDAKTFTVMGQGDLRTVELLKALARNKYSYCLALEYEEKPENPVDDIKACLAEVKKAIAEVRKA
jgi:sugar phosphate isomerase/epimerase